MIGGAFALKRKRKRELEEKRNGSVQDSILPGILSFGQQFYPSENRLESAIVYYDNRGIDSANCRHREVDKNNRDYGLTVVAIFILGAGLLILLISSILSGSVTTPITTIGLTLTSFGLFIFIIKCLLSSFLDRPTHQKLSPEQSEDDLHKPSSPSWIQIPINSDFQHDNYNHRHHQHHHHHLHHNQVYKHDKYGNAKHSKEPKYQLSGRLTETMSSIILDPSKLNKQSTGLNAEQPPFLINQQLITSLASSIDSTCEENYHDSVNKNLSLGELKETGSDDIKQRSSNTSPSFQLLTPISINDV